jgi:uncharacterized coiled-coil DUF342 family protein
MERCFSSWSAGYESQTNPPKNVCINCEGLLMTIKVSQQKYDQQIETLQQQLDELEIGYGQEQKRLSDGMDKWQQIAEKFHNHNANLQTKLNLQVEEITTLKKKLETIQNATCLACGRSISPDGDCYGCTTDMLCQRIQELEKQLEKADRIKETT